MPIKDGTPGKSDGKTCVSVCVYERKESVRVCLFFCQLSRLHVLHPFLSSSVPSSSSLYPPQVVVTSVDLCMDCVCMDFLLLTVTLTTVSIVSVTYTASEFRYCRVALREVCLLLPFLLHRSCCTNVRVSNVA